MSETDTDNTYSESGDHRHLRSNPLYGAIEKLLERQLETSSAAKAAASKLEGKNLALELTGISLNVFVLCTGQRIELTSEFNEEADVIISGSPMALLNFARSQDQDAFRGGGVKFTGDIGVAQEFQKLFGLLSPDFEEELSRLVGDEAAHQLGSIARDFFSWGRKAASSFSEGMGQYLSNAPGGNASQEDLESFFEEVDRMRADVDRAEIQVNRTLKNSEKN